MACVAPLGKGNHLGVHLGHLTPSVISAGFRHVRLANAMFLKKKITVGATFCSKSFSSHFSVVPVVRLSLFFFCSCNEEQNSISATDSKQCSFPLLRLQHPAPYNLLYRRPCFISTALKLGLEETELSVSHHLSC